LGKRNPKFQIPPPPQLLPLPEGGGGVGEGPHLYPSPPEDLGRILLSPPPPFGRGRI